MGIRGELFSTRFVCDGRTYFFNVKQNRTGDVFLSIVESKPSEGESFDRRSIVVFGEHMDGFLKAFQSALKFIEKNGIRMEANPSIYEDSDAEEGRRGSYAARKRPSSPPAEWQPKKSFEQGRPRGEFREQAGKPKRTYVRKTDREGGRPSFGGGRGAPRGESPRHGPSTAGEAKPVRRIVVKRAKKQDSED